MGGQEACAGSRVDTAKGLGRCLSSVTELHSISLVLYKRIHNMVLRNVNSGRSNTFKSSLCVRILSGCYNDCLLALRAKRLPQFM